ncbi:ABC transporter ATP-binding protein [Natronobacterium gregoryi]|uniref:ABC transporter n=2 Tax=Natronobacterium gregoryi TaxID=44930 RepID=L0ADU7_NATGS|nr:ABC transporter ATP-binding protein [Natronobacterium gregoryi]AFZ71317.1 ABC-type antimicrobial peptide transport system, ATPase component [Natronobacterium gregoryi SP2]ELY67206.1 ABC transporter [Natronobacterium gregoryi SP2]PLK19187.1 ABC transporter ATP-binding protein [Natronobacterium gregoryi SP2]SFJ59001.1 putative ABC transport system ATP-binding protein [Natronobacterium gregoryi]
MFGRSRRPTAGTRAHDCEESTPAVRLEGVGHEYGAGGDRSVTALRDVSLSVRTGEVVGLKGPSGSGKSTILHAVAGLLVPTEGTVALLGTDLTDRSDRTRTRLRRHHVGIVFQRFHLLPSLSARANVALPLVQTGVGRSNRRDRAEKLLEEVGLADRTTHLPGELSGGERQRVALARALAADPDVIVADEPTGELDTATGSDVLELLTDVGRDGGRAVLVASHDEATLSVADRVVPLRDGRVVTDGG